MAIEDATNGGLATPPVEAPNEQLGANDQPDEPTAKPKPSSRIKYRVEYVSPDNSVLHQYETKGPHYEEESTSANSRPVFEIVTSFKTPKTVLEKNDDTGFLPIGAAPMRSMRILSKAIMQALRSVVQYYPSQDLAGDVIKITSPYTVLVHHYDELMEYRDKFRPGSAEEVCYREKDAYEDLGILKAYLDEHIMPAVREEQARNARGYQTFDLFWVSLKPGSHLRGKFAEDNEPYVGIIHSFTGGSLGTTTTSWDITYWNLDYNGRWVGRRMHSVIREPFDGEEDIRSLDIKTSPRKEDIQELINKGGLYWSLLHHKQCKHYKGKIRVFPHNEVDGLVMVDMDAYYADNPVAIPSLVDPTTDVRAWISDCTCSVCSGRRTAITDKRSTLFEDYEIYFKNKEEFKLKDHQYLMLPRSIWAYVFRTRSWELLDVSGFSEPKFDENMIENLVMDEKRVQMLKALAKSYARLNKYEEKSELDMWSADFVKGKGNGLTFLLHGTPGVGKTCTAECIAAFTGRPLMVLTSSDIGIFPHEVEANLTRHFKQARSWGAVLLIDEADVFMERRSAADLNRNSLVAGFLRALEFYDGILFLTTNRVGAFDDAFISRIHVQLYYPEFDDISRRKVWQTFIDKLHHERGEYIRLNIDAKEYLEGKELRAVKWNGREIRNAFQTAVALAEYEAQKDKEGKIVLTDKHLQSVVEMSKDFKDYLSKLHRGDEAKRAERRNERLHE